MYSLPNISNLKGKNKMWDYTLKLEGGTWFLAEDKQYVMESHSKNE